MEEIKLRIYRYLPGKTGYYETYEVEYIEGMSVLDALNQIKWQKDGSLSFRRSCRSGICGSCAVNINGKNMLACQSQIKFMGKNLTISPIPGFRIIKDLVVEFEPFWKKLELIKPYLISKSIAPMRENLQMPKNYKKVEDSASCILCGACTSLCPSSWLSDSYLGTAALFKAYRFMADSRDEGFEDRVGIVGSEDGLWRCHGVYNCSETCPKELNPARYISKLKRMISWYRLKKMIGL
jgi:succinate dehydrogenase / fumarate reductase iron-sulfur subunit